MDFFTSTRTIQNMQPKIMSRSRKKNPFIALCKRPSGSDAFDKRLANRRFRFTSKNILHNEVKEFPESWMDYELSLFFGFTNEIIVLKSPLPNKVREVWDVWGGHSDGPKFYCPVDTEYWSHTLRK